MMTEIEELKAQLKVLEKKLSLLEEIEKTPIPKMELLKDGSVYGVDYDISANPESSFKFTFGPTLYDVVEDWWSDVFCASSTDDMETSIKDLVERIWKWMPSYQSAEGSQTVGVEELVTGWNDCLDKIRSKLG